MQSHLNTHPTSMASTEGAKGRVRRAVFGFSLLAAGAASVLVPVYGSKHLSSLSAPAAATPAASATPDRLQSTWIAAAPGRVEPRTGQVRVGTLAAGRILQLTVSVGDAVLEGDLLLRLDDREARARLAAAEAEVSVRQRERDTQPETAGREDVRKAEDALYAAERARTNARFALDSALASNRKSAGSSQSLQQARSDLAKAEDKLRQERAALAEAHAKAKTSAPNRMEAALIAARAELTLAEEAVERMRIRAPLSGSVLQIHAKPGELAMPSAEHALMIMGDLSLMRVRAEVDEQDVARIQRGQKVFVRSSGYPGREFAGTVAELAPTLAMPRMGSRGARRSTDVEVMEVLIDLDSGSPLLPGMRADVFFR